mmetsp:Transcript_8459/g.14842  ORF Transcript_8459/g.14842 Transcript_8459/m.14842 type:complete len:208 (+) Transcript_8459:232-855(+)
MLFNQFASVFILSSCLLLTANAGPFGIKSKGIENDDPAASDNENDNPLADLSDEELQKELLDVMEQFALMSDGEMEEAFSEVVDMLGDDDPEMLEAVREIKEALKSSDGSDESTPLMESMTTSTDKEIAEATDIALELISKSDDWESIHNKRDEILDSLIADGNISAEDAALFKSDDGAWEKELRLIWDGLTNLAKEGDNVKAMDEL